MEKGEEGLDKAYYDTVNRIKSQGQGIRELTEKALFWLVFAKRPLTTEELRHALTIEPGTCRLDKTNLCPVKDMVSSCAGLVTVDSNIIQLLYYPRVFSTPRFEELRRCTRGHHRHKLSYLPLV